MKDVRQEQVGELDKGNGEVLRVCLKWFHKTVVVDLRIWYWNEEVGKYLPTKRGCSLPIAQVPQLVEALLRAREQVEGEANLDY